MSGADFGDDSFMVTGTSAIFDSGTSLLALPDRDYGALVELIVNAIGSSNIICPVGGECIILMSVDDATPLLSNITFTFKKSTPFTITPT
mmetsp:Transcript_40507/g.39009  ORF Transcript_40507/g.39009 Transcript_40507/m.39009 type:complete len:90 (-) Transcript_40507:350-619(-)